MHSVTTNMFKEYTHGVLASISVYCVLIMRFKVWHRLRIRRKRIRSLGSTSTTGGSCD